MHIIFWAMARDAALHGISLPRPTALPPHDATELPHAHPRPPADYGRTEAHTAATQNRGPPWLSPGTIRAASHIILYRNVNMSIKFSIRPILPRQASTLKATKQIDWWRSPPETALPNGPNQPLKPPIPHSKTDRSASQSARYRFRRSFTAMPGRHISSRQLSPDAATPIPIDRYDRIRHHHCYVFSCAFSSFLGIAGHSIIE